MKIRTGFVSNSSSSSYLIVIAKDVYDQVISNVDGFTRAVLDEYFGGTLTFLGRECVRLCYIEGNYSSLEDAEPTEIMERAREYAKNGASLPDDFETEEWDFWDLAYGARDVLDQELAKFPADTYLTDSQDF